MARKKPQPEPQATALPHVVAEQYSVAPGVVSRFVCAEFGEVDLTLVTLEYAERLSAQGYLIKNS